jgi:rSAM/selenodomain-associated transferase 2
MQLSVIIPVLNEAERIAPLVRYLLENGGTLIFEVFVVEAGSKDETARLAVEAGAKILHCPVCSRAAQMNFGAKAAQGDTLYFVHADTLPPKSFAADIQASLEAGYLMGCYRYKFDSPSILLEINAFFNRFQWLWCQGGDKTFFIKKEIFEKMGGYNERHVIMEEYDFLRRTMPIYKLLVIPKYATVSARKYERNGWLRVQLANILVFNLWRFSMAPARLKKIYKTVLR